MILCVKEYCFHETKNFSGIMKKLHFGIKNRFLEIPVVLGTFWSSVVGAIDIFVAEHVANMLS